MPLRLVPDEPALLVEDNGGILAVSDLHLGYEKALEARGIRVPEQTKAMADRIIAIHTETRAKRLVILGDVKHDIKGASLYTSISVGSFFRALAGSFERIFVVPGNHDGGLGPLLPPCVRISGPGGLSMSTSEGMVGFFHGHAHPSAAVSRAKVLVTGHQHLMLGGPGGRRRIWVRLSFGPTGGERTLIVMPAFNGLLTGVPASGYDPGRWRPVLSEILEGHFSADAFLLDGSRLGSLSELAGHLLVDSD